MATSGQVCKKNPPNLISQRFPALLSPSMGWKDRAGCEPETNTPILLIPLEAPHSSTQRLPRLGMGTSGGAECLLQLEEHATKTSNVFITDETPNDFKRANSG